ncbi:hypothetical protein AHAS_Ahas09G0122100 [Arachis hypogaea]
MKNDRAEIYEGMNSDSDDDFEATYKASDKYEDGNGDVVDPKDGEFKIKMKYNSRRSSQQSTEERLLRDMEIQR